jgi:iduronate 2-sulfatase
MAMRTAVGFSVLILAVATARATTTLNVLLIISDDLRDTLHCYGNATIKSPNIDRLAARGVLFDHAYVQYPVCNPSRTSFLTGLRSEQTHVVDNRTMFRTQLPDVVTLPQLLRKNGWHTASFGKVFHVGEVIGEIREGWMDVGKSWDEGKMFLPTAAGHKIDGRNMTGGKLPWCNWGAMAGTDDDQPDGQTARHSIETIEKYTAGGTPWMVAAGFHRPHDPFLSPKRYFDLYPAGSMTIYHDPPDISLPKPLTMPGGAFAEAFKAFSETDRQEFQRAYYAGVSFMDAQVGRLMKTLDRLKLWDHTLVIFIGDNGYHHNERNWWNKHTLFERSCRVPCILVAPGAKNGEVCHSLIEFVDLYPTVADYCSIRTPPGLAGQSLRPLLKDPAGKGKPAAFTLVTRGGKNYGQAVRTEMWRYIHWSDGNSELYDEANDPQEVHDLSGDPAKSNTIEELQRLLAEVGPYKPAEPNKRRGR